MATVVKLLDAVVTPPNGMGVGDKDFSFVVNIDSFRSHPTELSFIITLCAEHHNQLAVDIVLFNPAVQTIANVDTIMRASAYGARSIELKWSCTGFRFTIRCGSSSDPKHIATRIQLLDPVVP